MPLVPHASQGRRGVLELSLLTKLPSSQRALIADGQPVILEIVVTEVTKQESQPASGSN
jgi:hypothetical protein